MDDIALILGPVVFQDFEATAGIRFGGEQRLAVHKLLGGNRIIDALGRDDSEIVLSGVFSGGDATLRARTLDELRVFGTVLPLTWDVFYFSVVIRNFEVDYRNPFWVPYRLCCTVLRDEAGAIIDTALSLATSVLADVGAAAAQGLGGVDLTAAQSAIAAPGAITLGTSAYSGAVSSLGSAQSQIATGLASTGLLLDSASTVLRTTNDPVTGTASLQSATSAAGRLGALSSMRGYVGRAVANLDHAST
jgi:hypothetical protein